MVRDGRNDMPPPDEGSCPDPEAVRTAQASSGAAPDYPDWAWRQMRAARPDVTARQVGTIPTDAMHRLAAAGRGPDTDAITITSHRIGHFMRDTKREGGRAIDPRDVADLARLLAKPDAVLRDRSGGEVLLIFTPSSLRDRRLGKVVVRLRQTVRYRAEGGRGICKTNTVVTAGLIPASTLRDAGRYEILNGSIPPEP